MDNTGHIGSTNLSLLRKYLGKNSRDIQPINNRKVFYNSGKKQLPSERNITVTNDKFLRCVKSNRPPQTTSRGNTTTPGPNSSYFAQGTKDYIRSITIFIVFGLLLVNAYYFVKYLYREEIAQKWLVMLGGKQVGDLRPNWTSKCNSLIQEKIARDNERKRRQELIRRQIENAKQQQQQAELRRRRQETTNTSI